jgi:hypothetical protein
MNMSVHELDLNLLREQVAKSNAEKPSFKWRSKMFGFARRLKAVESLSSLDGFKAAEIVERGLVMIRPDFEQDEVWEKCFSHSDDPRTDFISSWDHVRMPGDADVIQRAFQCCEKLMLKPDRCYSTKYAKFVSTAGHLQQSRKNKCIALPLKRLGALLECDWSTVGKYRKFAEKEGLLRLVANHKYVERKATEFEFDLERFDWITGEQIRIVETENEANSFQSEASGNQDNQSGQDNQELSGFIGLNSGNRVKRTEQDQAGKSRVPVEDKVLTSTQFEMRKEMLKKQAVEICPQLRG